MRNRADEIIEGLGWSQDLDKEKVCELLAILIERVSDLERRLDERESYESEQAERNSR